MLVEASTLGPLAFGGSGPQITCTLFGGIVAPFFQFNNFQRGNIIEVGHTVFCWLKPALLALWLSEAQVHKLHVLSLAALWHHNLLMNDIVMYIYYLLEKKMKYVSEDRMEGQTVTTVMILSFRTDRSGQTVQTQIRLLISV